MQKYKFSNPLSVVEVSLSALDRTDNKTAYGDPYRIYDCLCRGFGQNNKSPRKKYQIVAPTPNRAAQLAIQFYRKDFFSNGQE